MAMADIAAPSDVAQVAGKQDWRGALKALRRLLDDKDDTAQVFVIMRALNGRQTVRNYRRLLTSVEGGRLAYERVEFSARLMDEAWLKSLPAGSVGAAYRDFVRAENLSARDLVAISQQGLKKIEDPHPYAWLGRRTRDVHDIWHVLSGYGRDALGEACLVAFSFAQTRGMGWALIAVAVALRSQRRRGVPYRRTILEGYLRGRRARWLLAEDYERLMREPLESARARLGIRPPRLYDSIPKIYRERAVAHRSAVSD